MRNDYSKYTLIEMLRSYADGEEDTLGGNQRLDAADVIEQLQADLRKSRTMHRKACEQIIRLERKVVEPKGTCYRPYVKEET